MKTSSIFHETACAIIAMLLGISAPAQDASSWARTFTSTDGRQLKAIPISNDATSITVRRPEGGPPIVLPLDRLSAADVAFVKAWTLPATATPTPPAAASVAAKPKAPADPAAGKLVIVPINEGAAINPLGAGAFDKEPLKDSLFVDVDACDHHVLAVTVDGKAVCFGMDGDGKPMVDVLPKTKRKMVACTAARGRDYLMDEDGRIEVMRAAPNVTLTSRTKARRIFVEGRQEVVFAMNAEGKLQFVGHPNDQTDFGLPPALKDTAFRSLSMEDHIVGLTTEGKMHIWGKTGRGQLPLPPELVDQKIAAVGLRGSATIAVREDGKIIIWGEDRKWWSSKLESAPGTVEAWDLGDGYWGASIFRQETPQGRSYTVYSNSSARDAYLQKVLAQYKPIKITQTKDAIVMLSPQ